jgi:hypothetical protein
MELCFQTAGLSEMSAQGRMGLPHHIHQLCVRRALDGAEGRLYAVVTAHPEEESYDAEVVDAHGNKYVHLSGYRTTALPNSVDVEPLKALQAVAV